MAAGKAARSTAAWAKLLTVRAFVVDEVEARLKAAGLPALGWYDVLWALERAAGGRLRMAELADRLVVSRYNVTRLVDRMQDAGLVVREPAPDDARGAFAALTSAGRAMRRRMWAVYGPAIDELFLRPLSANERAAVDAAMAKVLEGAGRDG